jgi:hypothetical protein
MHTLFQTFVIIRPKSGTLYHETSNSELEQQQQPQHDLKVILQTCYT